MVLLKNERSFSGGDNHSHDIGGGDTQTLLTVKKVQLYALIVSGDVRTSGASPCTHYEPPGETHNILNMAQKNCFRSNHFIFFNLSTIFLSTI